MSSISQPECSSVSIRLSSVNPRKAKSHIFFDKIKFYLSSDKSPASDTSHSASSLPSEGLSGQPVPRQSNFELLRIIAMIMIVAHHYAAHGGFLFDNSAVTFNRLWTQFLWMGGEISVNIFVLISGYFLISSHKAKTHKALKLWLQIFTYSVVLFVLFKATGLEPFSFKQLFYTLLPISFSQWWFASTYFILYLVSPFLNKLLNALTKQEYQRLLLLLGFFWCFIPTFFKAYLESNNLLWFFYLYAVAGYVRLHKINSNLSSKTCLLLGMGMLSIIFLSMIIFDILGTRYPMFADRSNYYYGTYFCGQQKLPAFLASLFLFLGFKKMKIGYKKSINLISSATFGVYLIHDNNYMRRFLWYTLFHNASYTESPYLIPHSLCAILLVFVCCTLIELFRIYGPERSYTPLLSKFAAAIDRFQERFFNRL